MTTTFSYAELATRDETASLARFVRESTQKIKDLGAASHRNVVEIGLHLSQVKDRLAHGEWEAWLDYEFQWSAATARRLMQIHERFAHTPADSIRSLSQTALYALAAPSTPPEVVAEVVEEAAAGKPASAATVRAKVAKVQQRREPRGVGRPPNPWPEKLNPVMAEAHGDLKKIDQWLQQIRRQVNDLQREYEKRDDMLLAAGGLLELSNDLHAARQTLLRDCIPAGPCPYCATEGCETCRQTGWATRSFVFAKGQEVDLWT